MTQPSQKVDRFLCALWRRAWALRVVESAGMGVLIAAAGGLAMAAVMYGRHRSAEGAVIALMAVGAVAGGMVGALWRPKMLRVATEADRQLHLPELLSSAAALPVAGARDDLDRVLRQMLAGRAAEACARTSPRRIRQRRFGANGWAAIALAAGVPVLLGTLVSPPAPARPGAGDSAQAMAAADGEDAPLVQLA
ncbi:MAG TPA: hypothetical protein VHY37_07380, partial [Tepidisphaeraceae bacterium]|nr:hypothetical protein [Tepidisphaeraceae bacterium]